MRWVSNELQLSRGSLFEEIKRKRKRSTDVEAPCVCAGSVRGQAPRVKPSVALFTMRLNYTRDSIHTPPESWLKQGYSTGLVSDLVHLALLGLLELLLSSKSFSLSSSLDCLGFRFSVSDR